MPSLGLSIFWAMLIISAKHYMLFFCKMLSYIIYLGFNTIMTNGGKPGGVENHDCNYRENIELTLPISADEILTLSYSNTSVYSSRENSEVDCIEITLPTPEGTPARVHRIFERPDLMAGLGSLGFRLVTDRYASEEHVRAYAEWATSDCDGEWAVIAQDGVSLSSHTLEAIPHITRDSPVVELHLNDDEIFKATYNNTQLHYINGDSIIRSYISLYTINDETGVTDRRFMFDVLEIMKELEKQDFPVTRQPYPSNAAIAAYEQRFAHNIDKTLDHMVGRYQVTPE